MGGTGWLIVACGLFAAGTNLAFVLGQPHSAKRFFRLFNCVAVLYVAIIYVLMETGTLTLFSHGAMLVRPAVGVLLLLLAAEPIADWKRL